VELLKEIVPGVSNSIWFVLNVNPLSRQIAIRKEMSVIDSARFMTVTTAAEADAAIAVMDAKYNYAFWRPITAIRNGDIDGNDATEREATWQPIDNTPMHPEYPCAHCIISSAVASAIESDARHGRHSRSGDDQPDSAWGDASLDAS
jgi:hypothetical protein